MAWLLSSLSRAVRDSITEIMVAVQEQEPALAIDLLESHHRWIEDLRVGLRDGTRKTAELLSTIHKVVGVGVGVCAWVGEVRQFVGSW